MLLIAACMIMRQWVSTLPLETAARFATPSHEVTALAGARGCEARGDHVAAAFAIRALALDRDKARFAFSTPAIAIEGYKARGIMKPLTWAAFPVSLM